MGLINKLLYVLLGISLIFGFSTTLVAISNTSHSYYVSSSPIIITSDSDFALYNFPGTGTVDDPYIIENFNITGAGDCGIYISAVSAYFVIRNCIVDGFDEAITLSAVLTPLVIIDDNYLSAKVYGINSAESIYTTLYAFRNVIKSGFCGISIADEKVLAIVNNTITGGTNGIILSSIETGLILNNTIDVSQWGVSVNIEVTNTEICWNTITGFSEVAFGIAEESNENVVIHHNTAILKQSDGTFESLAMQVPSNNKIYWYDNNTKEGNYWSDWTGSGTYPVVDPYGNVVNEDLYPLANPPVPTNKFPGIPTPPYETTSTSTSSETSSNQASATNTSQFTNPLAINTIGILLSVVFLGVTLSLIKNKK